MRILAVTNMYPSPEYPASGVFVHEQVKSLQAIGLGVRVLLIDRRREGALAYYRMDPKLTEAVGGFNPDLIHVMYGGVMADRVARRHHVRPLVITFHGSDLLGENLSGWARRVISRYGVRCSRKAAKAADGVVVVANREQMIKQESAQLSTSRYNLSQVTLTAPFDGVITARNTDLGALIDAGAGAQARELFRLASTSKLRVFVSVPQAYAQAARPGTPTAITLEENPGKVYRGTLARTSTALDPNARTMLSEVEMDNPTGEVLPGAYVVVRLRVGRETRGMTIPANTLLFRSEGLRAVVVDSSQRVRLRALTVGRDYGVALEVLDGLKPEELIVLNPADSLDEGQLVRPMPVSTPGADQRPGGEPHPTAALK